MHVNKLYFGNSLAFIPLTLMEEFLEKLRQKAVYFKLTSKPKYGGAVSVEDVISVLRSLSESYNSFVDAEYDKINTQQDRKKLKMIKQGLADENNLMVVDLRFESCGMAVTPNVITHKHTIPQIKDQPQWKKETFESYKAIVLNSDFNDKNYLKQITKMYNPVDRQKIFKPIIDGIINNEKSSTTFSFGIKNKPKPLSKPKTESYTILVPAPQALDIDIQQEIRTSLAMVEIKGKSARPKVLELFDEVKNPVYSFSRITFNGNQYNFRFPIYCELIHEAANYSMENRELGIYAYGKTIDEAQKCFFEEFDYVYTRYNSLTDEQLTGDVLEIKKLLNLIVI